MKLEGYLRYELLRTFRNRRYLLLSFGFPLVLYFLIAAPNRGNDNFGGSGLSAPLYYMVGLASFGAMSAMLSAGGRIATERSVGWNRQLRLTPLSSREYFRTKIVTAYLVALSTLLLLYASGSLLGVRLSAQDWLWMTALMLVGLIPFGALAVLFGHLLSPDSIGPAMGGSVAVLAFLGGTWFPITGNGVLAQLARLLPSYWLVQASHVALGGSSWGTTGWLVIATWTIVLSLLAARAYRRDTNRL
jgi:ABC-2 type transport system permease protein